jgi:hypothetical protein
VQGGHGAWPRQAGGAPTVARSRRIGSVLNRGVPGAAEVWAPTGSGRERERRGAMHVGRPGRKKRSGSSPDEQESF